jgi:hypothetical protein
MEYLKVEGHDYLLRDKATGAIINSDSNGYNDYVKMKQIKMEEQKKISDMQSEINGLKNDLSEIKNLLKEFVNGSK